MSHRPATIRYRFGWVRSALLVALLLCCAVKPVWANDERRAAAQLAFDEGLALHQAGKYAQACKKFEKSLALEAAIGTRFQLAECYEKIGRLASAWKYYVDVADEAQKVGRADRESFARGRAAAVLPRLSKLRIAVGETMAELPDLKLELNGKPVARALWNTQIPVDQGPQRISVSAEGRASWTKTVSVTTEGKTVTVRVPVLEPAVDESAVPPNSSAGSTPSSSGLSGQAIAGIVTGAVGLVGMAVGIALGVTAKSRYDDAADHCNKGQCADDEWLDQTNSARSQGNAATAVFIVGAVAVATGVVVWVTAPSSSESSSDRASAAARLGLGIEVKPTFGGASWGLRGSW